MKTKTIILIASIVAFLTTVAIAYRAQAAIIVNPIPVPNCALCAPSTKTVEKMPVPVAASKALKAPVKEMVEVDTAEIEKLMKQIAELQKILAALLAQRN